MDYCQHIYSLLKLFKPFEPQFLDFPYIISLLLSSMMTQTIYTHIQPLQPMNHQIYLMPAEHSSTAVLISSTQNSLAVHFHDLDFTQIHYHLHLLNVPGYRQILHHHQANILVSYIFVVLLEASKSKEQVLYQTTFYLKIIIFIH